MLNRKDKSMLLNLVMLLIGGFYLWFIKNEWTFVPNTTVYVVTGIILVTVYIVGSYLIGNEVENE